jgi:hypothetical protein
MNRKHPNPFDPDTDSDPDSEGRETALKQALTNPSHPAIFLFLPLAM